MKRMRGGETVSARTKTASTIDARGQLAGDLCVTQSLCHVWRSIVKFIYSKHHLRVNGVL